MRGDPRLIDDLSRLASGAFNTLGGMRVEAREQMRERLRRVFGGSEASLREEVAAALELAANARAEQEKLQQRVDALEARLAELESPGNAAPRRARPAPKRPPKSDLDGKKIAGS